MRTDLVGKFGICTALFVHPPGDICHPVSEEQCLARVRAAVEVIIGFFRVPAVRAIIIQEALYSSHIQPSGTNPNTLFGQPHLEHDGF